MSFPRVIVIGGGLAGLSVAQGLHNIGFTPRVFDQQANKDHYLQKASYVTDLNQLAIKDLQKLFPKNTLESIHTDSFEVFPSFCSTDANLDIKAVFPNQIKERALKQIYGGDLLKYLSESVNINWNKRCLSFEKSDSSEIIVSFEDGTKESCDILVAADGRYSKIVQQMYSEPANVAMDISTISGWVPYTNHYKEHLHRTLHHTTLCMGRGDAFLMSVFRKNLNDPGKLTWRYSVRDSKFKIQAQKFDDHWEKVKSKWHPIFSQLIQETDRANLTDFEPVSFGSLPGDFVDSNYQLIVVGDAAHSFTPFLDRGANFAVSCGANLASSLQPLVQLNRLASVDIQEAVSKYRVETSGPAVQTILQSKEAAVLAHNTTGWISRWVTSKSLSLYWNASLKSYSQ